MGREGEGEGISDDRSQGIEKEVEKEGECRSEGRRGQSRTGDIKGIHTGTLR